MAKYKHPECSYCRHKVNEEKRMYLFAHNAKNYVHRGQRVKKGDRVGTIGTANGQWYAHLHLSVSKGLTVEQIFGYVRWWKLDKVKKYYEDPRKTVDKNKLFKLPIDEGHRGWGYLQKMGWRYYHPGIDYNGLGGGNTDYGYRFYSPVNGKVVFSGDRGGKWGYCVIIEEE